MLAIAFSERFGDYVTVASLFEIEVEIMYNWRNGSQKSASGFDAQYRCLVIANDALIFKRTCSFQRSLHSIGISKKCHSTGC